MIGSEYVKNSQLKSVLGCAEFYLVFRHFFHIQERIYQFLKNIDKQMEIIVLGKKQSLQEFLTNTLISLCVQQSEEPIFEQTFYQMFGEASKFLYSIKYISNLFFKSIQLVLCDEISSAFYNEFEKFNSFENKLNNQNVQDIESLYHQSAQNIFLDIKQDIQQKKLDCNLSHLFQIDIDMTNRLILVYGFQPAESKQGEEINEEYDNSESIQSSSSRSSDLQEINDAEEIKEIENILEKRKMNYLEESQIDKKVKQLE